MLKMIKITSGVRDRYYLSVSYCRFIHNSFTEHDFIVLRTAADVRGTTAKGSPNAGQGLEI